MPRPRTSLPSPASTLQKTKSPNTFRYRSRKKLKSPSRSAKIFTPAWAHISSARSSQKNRRDRLQAGFATERAFLQDAKLDVSGISQGDGAGGDWADLFSPDFIC